MTITPFHKYFVVLALALLSMSSCSNDFTIEGNFADGGTKNIRVVYATPDGVDAQWITMTDGKFKIKGVSEDMTVVYIFNQQKKLIAHVVAQNGDNVKMEGNLFEPFLIKIKGTTENEEWNKFITDNKEIFQKNNSNMIDIAVEKYIRENPSSVTSTLLLLNDYSSLADTKNINRLLSLIDESAKPQSLLRSYQAFMSQHTKDNNSKNVPSFMLYSSRDSIEVFNPAKNKYSLMYFWTFTDDNHHADVAELRSIVKERKDKNLQVIDINLASDTTQWRSNLRVDSTTWTHFWAVGGVMNNSIKDFNINSSPYYMIVDSLGHKIYQGYSLPDVRKTIETKIK